MNQAPYTADEWSARGELGAGKGAFLKLNSTAYVVAVENGDGAQWRLEDVASRTGDGRLAVGTSRSLDAAQRDAAHALTGRYPALANTEPTTPPQPHRTTGGPMQLDYDVAAVADSDSYSRQLILDRLGDRLTDDDHSAFGSAPPAELARLLGSAGITAATTVAVLHADGCPVDDIAVLLPTLGVPMASAINVLHARWDVDRVAGARMLAATGAEMREAGCSAEEILAYRPDSILERLPREPHLWELAAGTMATSGHSAANVVSHLVHFAPSPECFAAGVAAAIDDPSVGLTHASQLRAQPDRLAATAERYGLDPAEAAQILRGIGAPTAQVVATLGALCDYDDTAVTAAWRGEQVVSLDTTGPAAAVTQIGGNEIGSADELLALLPHPGSSPQLPDLFAAFAVPLEPLELALDGVKR